MKPYNSSGRFVCHLDHLNRLVFDKKFIYNNIIEPQCKYQIACLPLSNTYAINGVASTKKLNLDSNNLYDLNEVGIPFIGIARYDAMVEDLTHIPKHLARFMPFIESNQK